MTYALNKEGAKQANEKLSGYIDKNGDYLLKVTLAEWIAGKSPKQSRGIRLHLVDSNSSKATIDLWFQKGDGTRNDMSANMLDGLMTCVNLQNLSESMVTVAGNNINTCPELENKCFGALIQVERDAYVKDGDLKEIDKPFFYSVYNYKTKLTPNEILSGNTQAIELNKLSVSLENAKPRFTKNHKELMNGGFSGGSSSGYGSAQNNSQVDLDSDLPF